jgi:hypothetical protein
MLPALYGAHDQIDLAVHLLSPKATAATFIAKARLFGLSRP